MADQRFDAWIPEELKAYLAERAKREGNKGMNQVLADILRAEIAREQGAIIEQQSLPVIHEIVQTELRKALATQRQQIREDMSLEFTNEFKAVTRASDNRLAALLVRAIRDSSISKRLSYTLLSKLVSPSFAQETYEVAQERAGKELARKEDGLS